MLRNMGKKTAEYELVGNEEKDDDPSIDLSARLATAQRLEQRARTFLQISVALCVTTLFALTAMVYLRKPISEFECHKITSPFSPAFAAWDENDLWEGDFVNYFNHSTIYRGPPTLEREEAWDNLWSHMAIGLDAEGAAKLNRTHPETYIETLDSDPNHPTYGTMLEVFHQLHCLNLVRQATWPLDRFDPAWGDLYPNDLVEPVGARMHVDHCLEALRLSLMCYADVTPMLIIRDESRALGSFADFNMHHKCRDFDKLVEWVDRTGTDIPPTNSTPLEDNPTPPGGHSTTLKEKPTASGGHRL